MKRVLSLLLILCMSLSLFGCGSKEPVASTGSTTLPPTQTPTTQATTPPTTEATVPSTSATEPSQPTTEPSQPASPVAHRNPLNGQPLEEAYVGRLFAVTINNSSQALPHRGVGQADLFFEMYVNDYITRGLAVFSDVSQVESIGSIRSTRYNFTDLALAYDLILCHARGSDEVMNDMKKAGVDNFSADGTFGYRDYDRYNKQGYSWEHCLFVKGTELIKAAQKAKFDLALTGRDYGLQFKEDGTPVNGSAAELVEIVFNLYGHKKTTTMKYDATLGKYVWWQYKKEMIDENNGQKEAFENVIVLLTEVENKGVYHVANLYGSGKGYFACNGKIIPIRWSHANEKDPIRYTLEDGTPLELGVGNTYVAIAPLTSSVNYQ